MERNQLCVESKVLKMDKTQCLINLVCQKILLVTWNHLNECSQLYWDSEVVLITLTGHRWTSVFCVVLLYRLKWHDGSTAGSAALSAFSFFVLTVTSLAALDQIPHNPFLTSTTGKTFALGKHGKAAIEKWTVSWQNVFPDRTNLSSPLKQSGCIFRIVGWGFPDCHDGLFHSLESF